MAYLDHFCLCLPQSIHCGETEMTQLKRALGGNQGCLSLLLSSLSTDNLRHKLPLPTKADTVIWRAQSHCVQMEPEGNLHVIY